MESWDERNESTLSGSRLPWRELTWRCPPTRWEIDVVSGGLHVWSDSGTDFWQRTHYGFRADNGHLMYLPAKGTIRAETRVRIFPHHQYDQAGLMIWISPSCWIKTSVEYEPDSDCQLGAVVTNSGYSDWSTQPVDRSVREFWFRLSIDGSLVVAYFSLNGIDWRQLRMATLLERNASEPVCCGLYLCSPRGSGFKAEFDYLSIQRDSAIN